MNPLTWSLPYKILGVCVVALLLYALISAGIGTVWARHVAGVALKGIARTLSDYDKVEADSAAKDQAIEALAKQTQELEKKAAAEHEARQQAAQHAAALTQEVVSARQQLDEARRREKALPDITTLEQAVDVFNKAVAK